MTACQCVGEEGQGNKGGRETEQGEEQGGNWKYKCPVLQTKFWHSNTARQK